MTMLDTMRRHKGWLKWSLALVVLTFVWLYIPSFLPSNQAGATSPDRVASVGDRTISANDFRRRYQAQINAYRSSYATTSTMPSCSRCRCRSRCCSR
jgi:hypothetical protein